MKRALCVLAGLGLTLACTGDFDQYEFEADNPGAGGSGASGGSAGSSTGGSAGSTGGTAGTSSGGVGGSTGGSAGTGGGTGGGAGMGTGGMGTGGAGGMGTGGAGGMGTGGAAGMGTGGGAGMAGTGGSTGLPSCNDTYAGINGVNNLCLESMGSCELNFRAQTASCDVICGQGGGECTGVFDNTGPCGHGPPGPCNATNYQEAICICTRGCGNNPPCPGNQRCTNGTCMAP